MIENQKMSQSKCCRLCCSNNNLISMFGGKTKNKRDLLRKMIFEILQLEIRPSDSVTSVCFNCCVDISNFFTFKLNYLHCQEYIEMKFGREDNNKKIRLQCSDLHDMQIPGIKDIECIINWLVSKGGSTSKKTEDIGIQTSRVILRDMPVQVSSEPVKNVVDNATMTLPIIDETNSKLANVLDVQNTYQQLNSRSKHKMRSNQNKNRSCQTNFLWCSDKDKSSSLGTSKLKYTNSETRILKDNLTETSSSERGSESAQCSLSLSPSKNSFRPVKSQCNTHREAIEETKSPEHPNPCKFEAVLPLSSVLCSKVEMALHNRIHLRCILCRKKFRSQKGQSRHLNACKMKHCLDRVPYVELERLNYTNFL
ncbi:uncharacterized protein LOC132704944 isoform X2 [Cylas formicarius]|uniref:uncharacterized protein LOC132704944 isoform X2 n=1 Tax=Cylas formicarius TaxID=197179 RepID=UPI002958B5F5|nr:uncharacterized protein LOC132704944 isoform X2 [Cylas formicarius]